MRPYDGEARIADTWLAGAFFPLPAPFDSPFMISLTQGLGVYGNAFNPATTPLPATLQIDYVRAWS